nr:MAG TPA: hypothetical protein [Caudoviricetes sp.]
MARRSSLDCKGIRSSEVSANHCFLKSNFSVSLIAIA